MRTNLAQNFKIHLQGNLVHKAFARKEIFFASKIPLCIVIVQCAAPWDSGKLQTWIHSSWYGKTLNKKHERIEVLSMFLSHISYTWSHRLYLKLFLLIKSWCRHSHLLGSVFDLPVDDSQVLWIRLFPRFIPLAFLGSFHFCGYYVSVAINSFQVVMLQEQWQPSAEAVWNISEYFRCHQGLQLFLNVIFELLLENLFYSCVCSPHENQRHLQDPTDLQLESKAYGHSSWQVSLIVLTRWNRGRTWDSWHPELLVKAAGSWMSYLSSYYFAPTFLEIWLASTSFALLHLLGMMSRSLAMSFTVNKLHLMMSLPSSFWISLLASAGTFMSRSLSLSFTRMCFRLSQPRRLLSAGLAPAICVQQQESRKSEHCSDKLSSMSVLSLCHRSPPHVQQWSLSYK